MSCQFPVLSHDSVVYFVQNLLTLVRELTRSLVCSMQKFLCRGAQLQLHFIELCTAAKALNSGLFVSQPWRKSAAGYNLCEEDFLSNIENKTGNIHQIHAAMFITSATDVSLTTDNILRDLHGVNLHRLGSVLSVPDHKRAEIKQQHSTQTNRMRAIIEYWLSVDPAPSWRKLLFTLEYCGLCQAEDKVKPHVEPLIGKK